VLAEADAAREVRNELLALAEPGGIATQDGLERVSTLFTHFAGFADSVRDVEVAADGVEAMPTTST
jgi:hypothetical protein